MKHLFSFCSFASVLLGQFFRTSGLEEATAPGDIIIGGLFPIHESVVVASAEDGQEKWTCTRFSEARLVQSLIMVHAVEEVNKRKELGNLTIGYRIQDTCSDVTAALTNTQSFMKQNKQSPPPVVAVVGGYHSEISIAVTRQLNLEHIPQISYGSTSGFLSDKKRFPSFMRTVPEDDHQARAIISILIKQKWTWVGVVTTDGDYGRYIVDRLQQHAKDHNICFAFTSVLRDNLGDDELKGDIKETVRTITENKNVTVIVSVAKSYHMMYLFQSLLKEPEGRGKVWVASDNWSESASVLRNWIVPALSDAGTIFGTTLKSRTSASFERYLRDLDADPDHHKNNPFLSEFLRKQQEKRHKPVNNNDTASEVLMKMIYPYAVFSVELAVRAVVQAVADLCVNRDCRTNQTLQPLEVREALRNATFHMDGKSYKFDDRGDLNSGYDIILWRQTSTHVDVHHIVAHYSIETQSLNYTSPSLNKVIEHVVSRCSHSCPPGFRKQSAPGQPVCCYECHPCAENHFSNTTDSITCEPCNSNTHYAPMNSTMCLKKETIFLKWDDVYHDTLLAFTALGALLTIVVGIIFLARWNTPVVRASVGPICILLLFSLLSTFVSVILFGGKPNKMQCKARQVLFGLSFTLCVSCILVKSFKIILAFEFDPSVSRVLKKLYHPYIILAVCMSGQVLICALWLALKPPQRMWKDVTEKGQRLLICSETSFAAFGVMLGYIGVLALICFGVAFKGRKLPQSYNDAKFITFSMLIYFICWVIFGPVHVNVTGRYIPAVEMVVILISAYGILFCQFFTKCYIILFKQEANTESAFRQDVRNYSLGSLQGLESVGIQNSSFVGSSNSVSMDPVNNRHAISSWSQCSPSPVLNTQLLRLQNSHNFNHKQLRRYFSLPESIPK